jgi:hypothetical protein
MNLIEQCLSFYRLSLSANSPTRRGIEMPPAIWLSYKGCLRPVSVTISLLTFLVMTIV